MKRVKRGLTLLEVIFSMGIILFGLVSIALLVPYAARQANESQTITYSLANGISASAMTKSSSLLTPTEESPWQIVDDSNAAFGDSNRTVFTSFRDLYSGRDRFAGAAPPYNLFRHQYLPTQVRDYPASPGQPYVDPTNRLHAWININRALGTCFYLDPNFLGQQAFVSPAKIARDDWSPFRRNRFPYYSEDYLPSANTTGPTPRLWRISLRDSNVASGVLNSGWMKAAAARLLTSSYGGEIDQLTASKFTSVPVRNFLTTENSDDALHIPDLIRGGTGSTRFGGSWAIMICPDEDTPIVPKSTVRLIPPQTNFSDFRSPVYPELYNISMVLYGKRNVSELTPDSSLVTGFSSGAVLPEAEKVASVTGIPGNNLSMNSGNFEIVLNASSALNANIVPGDWIMLSRYVVHFEGPPTPGVFALRQRHRWYRVVSAPSSPFFPCTVRVSGTPWDWTANEIRSAREAGIANLTLSNPIDPTSPYYQFTQTTATIVPKVVHVFQRTFDLGK